LSVTIAMPMVTVFSLSALVSTEVLLTTAGCYTFLSAKSPSCGSEHLIDLAWGVKGGLRAGAGQSATC